MEMTPQEIAATTFRVVKKGFDPEEVRAFQMDVAHALEAAQTQTSMMEQRARAAVAKAQGLAASAAAGTAAGEAASAAPAPNVVALRADDAETISRTLVLAQRTAERTVAEAEQEAAAIRTAAQADAEHVVEQAKHEGARLLVDARSEARRAAEMERGRITNEIQSLLARLDFLRGDVEEMEAYAAAHRRRLADAAEALRLASEQPVLGLGDLKRPVLSPAADMARAEVDQAVATSTAAARPAEAPPAVVIVPAAAVVDEETEVAVDEDWDEEDWPEEEQVSAPATLIADVTPGAGSPLLPPTELVLSDLPTGEIPVVRPTSGPVTVPDLDLEWDEEPAEPARRGPNDLRIVGEP